MPPPEDAIPFIPALQGDVADVLTPLILDGLDGIQLGSNLTHIQLRRRGTDHRTVLERRRSGLDTIGLRVVR